jgi:hypothetical protein
MLGVGVFWQNSLFLHYSNPKSHYDKPSVRVVQTYKFSREFRTLPVIKSGFTPGKLPLYPALSLSAIYAKEKEAAASRRSPFP